MLSARLVAATAVALVYTACASAGPPVQGPTDPGPVTGVNALPVGGLGQVGDTIYVVEVHVRADAREQFETFVQNTLWPAFQDFATPAMPGRELIRRIRFLQPQAPDADGAFTYGFLLDPVVPPIAYNILEILTQKYGQTEARSHYDTWTGMWARDFTVRRFVQSR